MIFSLYKKINKLNVLLAIYAFGVASSCQTSRTDKPEENAPSFPDDRSQYAFLLSKSKVSEVSLQDEVGTLNIDYEKLNTTLNKKKYLLSDFSEIAGIELVNKMSQDLDKMTIKTPFDLSDYLVKELYLNLRYTASLGAESARPESYYLTNRIGICDSISRVYVVLFKYFTEKKYPQFSDHMPIYLIGVRKNAYQSFGNHAFNSLIHIDSSNKNSLIKFRIVDATWNDPDVTRTRISDFVYYLYENAVISAEEAKKAMLSVIRKNPEGRFLAIVNSIALAIDEKEKNSWFSISAEETLKTIVTAVSVLDIDIDHREISENLIAPIEDYIIMGSHWWNHYKGVEINEFAREVNERSIQSLKLVAQLNAKLGSKVQQHIQNIQDFAMRIQTSASISQSEDEFKKLIGSIIRTRKNQTLLQDLLKSRPQNQEEL